MKAWKLVGKNKFELVTRDLTEMDENKDVKIKMSKVMFSRDDCFLMNNPPEGKQLILGTAGIGVVSEVFDATTSRFSRMDRVIIEPYIACGTCRYCQDNKQSLCRNKQVLGVDMDGLMQDFICLPHNCLYLIPDVVSTDNAVLTPLISLALNVIDKINLDKGDHVAIFGGGILGIVIAALANYYQAMPILVDNDPTIIQTALYKNIFYSFLPEKDDINAKIFTATGGRKCEKVVFLTESITPIDVALDNCGIGGTVCLCGTHKKDITMPMQYILEKNLTVNAVDNSYGNFLSALNILTKGVIKADDFIREEVNFADVDKTLPDITEVQTLRKNIVVKCE